MEARGPRWTLGPVGELGVGDRRVAISRKIDAEEGGSSVPDHEDPNCRCTHIQTDDLQYHKQTGEKVR